MQPEDLQLREEIHPCRIVIIGLPYSGKKKVAEILQSKHNCKQLQLDPCLSPNTKKSPYKVITQLCFQDYHGVASFVLTFPNLQTLLSLKKRNFVNIILVESTFSRRYNNYLQANDYTQSFETMKQFSSIQNEYLNNKDYQESLQFARVRIFNNSSEEVLRENIEKNIKSIIRPFRPDYHQYFMKIADVARRRSNCMKSSVGAVIVNDNNRVVSTGYNGTPRGLVSCFKDGCKRCNLNEKKGLDECLCLHGEESAILEVGIQRTAGCILYTTMYPCFSCAKLIKQAGIKKIFYMDEYQKQDSGQKFIKQNFANENVVQVLIDNLYY